MREAGAGLARFARQIAESMAKDPRRTARAALGLLLAANLAAAAAVFRPWGGSQDDLQRQFSQLLGESRQREAAVKRLRALVESVEKTRAEADQFFQEHFLDRATAYSTVLSELTSLAEESGMKPKDHSFSYEPIEGSDTMAMMTITGNYEGSYGDLIQFMNELDRSPRFLTIDRLQAAPVQGQAALNVSLRLNVFVRGEAEQQ